jgi:hypothetical protein
MDEGLVVVASEIGLVVEVLSRGHQRTSCRIQLEKGPGSRMESLAG